MWLTDNPILEKIRPLTWQSDISEKSPCNRDTPSTAIRAPTAPGPLFQGALSSPAVRPLKMLRNIGISKAAPRSLK